MSYIEINNALIQVLNRPEGTTASNIIEIAIMQEEAGLNPYQPIEELEDFISWANNYGYKAYGVTAEIMAEIRMALAYLEARIQGKLVFRG